MVTNVHRSSGTVAVNLVRVERNLNFLSRFEKNTQISNLMKIRQVGAQMFHVDGRTDGWRDRYDNVNSRLSQFCERAYNSQYHDIKNNPTSHPVTQLYIYVLYIHNRVWR
jgi:hypothetical protein